MSLVTGILLALQISVMLTVFALGLTASLSDATMVLRRPRQLGRALLAMNVVMPAVAIALAATLQLKPAVKIALVALAASPIPPLFPKRALKATHHSDYGIGLLIATAVLAVVITPLTMQIASRVFSVPLSMPPGAVAVLVLKTVLLPLLAGSVIHSRFPDFAVRAAKPIARTAMVVLVVACLPVLLKLWRPLYSLVGDGSLLSMAAFALVGYLSGYAVGGPTHDNRDVLGLANACRHPGVAVAIAHTNFPEQRLAVPAVVLYLVVSFIVCAILMRVFSHSKSELQPA